MTLYTVLEPPDSKPDRVVFLPEGFSWGALVFTVIWAFVHRMWVVAAALFVLFAAFNVGGALGLLSPPLVSVFGFGLSVIFGFEARRLQTMSLERAGFRRAGLIQASHIQAAELAYFASRAPSPPKPAAAFSPAPGAVPYRPRPEDTLGIFGNV